MILLELLTVVFTKYRHRSWGGRGVLVQNKQTQTEGSRRAKMETEDRMQNLQKENGSSELRLSSDFRCGPCFSLYLISMDATLGRPLD